MLDSVKLATEEQPAPLAGQKNVTDLVVGDLTKRQEMGKAKYGKPLETHNGRNALVDAYQELLDLTLYIRQELEEDATKPAERVIRGTDWAEENRKLGEEAIYQAEQQQKIQGAAVAENPAASLTDAGALSIGSSGHNLTTVEDSRIELTSKITVDIVQSMGGDHMVVAAAKVSVDRAEAMKFASQTGHVRDNNYGLINYLMKHRHGSAFEHSAMTFFVHAPIFVWREWHRHRIGFSYNETSGRYQELEPIFWIPGEDRKIVPDEGHKSARPKFKQGTPDQLHDLQHSLSMSYAQSYYTYKQLLQQGIAKEVARACLPVAIYSSCWVTCNPRSLMSFLSLRTHEPAATFVSYPQAEIEVAARAIESIFAAGWPLTYRAFCENGRVAP